MLAIKQDILNEAAKLASSLDADSLKESLRKYNTSVIDKYLLIGAIVKIYHEKNGVSRTEVVDKLGKLLNSAETVKYAYTFFRIYPYFNDELALQTYANHILNIIKYRHEALARASKYKYNNPSRPEMLDDESILILAQNVNDALDYLFKANISSEVQWSKLLSKLKEKFAKDDVRRKTYREPYTFYDIEERDDNSMAVVIEKPKEEIIDGEAQLLITKEGDKVVKKKVVITLLLNDE